MTEEEQKIISIIKQAKANLECEEDIKIDDKIVEKIFYEKIKKEESLINITDTSYVKRKEFSNVKNGKIILLMVRMY